MEGGEEGEGRGVTIDIIKTTLTTVVVVVVVEDRCLLWGIIVALEEDYHYYDDKKNKEAHWHAFSSSLLINKCRVTISFMGLQLL